MNVYIATALGNKKNHNRLRDALVKYNIQLSYDWTLERDPEISRSDLAWNELSGIYYADVVVVLLPGGRGTHVEFGYALALNKPIIVHGVSDQINGELGECIFFALETKDILRLPSLRECFSNYGADEKYDLEKDIERLAALVTQRVTVTKNLGLSKDEKDGS